MESFHSPLMDNNLSSTILASCAIQPSFHPLDLFEKSLLSHPDGCLIDGKAYVNGGIAAKAPPVGNMYEKVIMPPISVG